MVLKTFTRMWKGIDGEGSDQSRRHLRVQPSRADPVEVQIMGEDSLNILHARDVSVSGIGVLVPHRFEGCNIQNGVELVITLPGTRSFMARGQVIHKHEDDITAYFGVEFTRLENRHRELIIKYVQEFPEDPAPSPA